MTNNSSSFDEEIENLNLGIDTLKCENAELKQKIEDLEAENADLKKKVEQASSNSTYYFDQYTKFYADMERIHKILDHLKPVPPRTGEKTEDNQWPEKYDVITRLSIWLGNK